VVGQLLDFAAMDQAVGTCIEETDRQTDRLFYSHGSCIFGRSITYSQIYQYFCF